MLLDGGKVHNADIVVFLNEKLKMPLTTARLVSPAILFLMRLSAESAMPLNNRSTTNIDRTVSSALEEAKKTDWKPE